jgi:GTPase involved in cell partitioning and DNA repair
MHFKNAVKQYPDFAMYGEPGEEKEIEAELQLI